MKSFLTKLGLWMQQSTSILGSSGIAGTVVAVLTHQITWQQGLPVIITALIAIAMPQLSAPSRDEIAKATSQLVVDKFTGKEAK